MRQLVDGDSSVVFRSILWDDVSGELLSLEQIGKRGDSTRIAFEWIRVDGRVVPALINMEHSASAGTIQAETAFSGWLFPRSIPSFLFTIR